MGLHRHRQVPAHDDAGAARVVRAAALHVRHREVRRAELDGRVGAAERASGFRIITGVGRHSAGGKGVLGPAVKKGLEQDGWRLEVNSGAITVRGKSRAY